MAPASSMFQCAPHARLVATVRDGVVHAPVGIGIIAEKPVLPAATGLIAGIVHADGPRLVGVGATLPSAGAPAEEVNPVLVTGRYKTVGYAHHLVLLLCESPCVCGGLILQVPPRETHLPVRRHREERSAGTVVIKRCWCEVVICLFAA